MDIEYMNMRHEAKFLFVKVILGIKNIISTSAFQLFQKISLQTCQGLICNLYLYLFKIFAHFNYFFAKTDIFFKNIIIYQSISAFFISISLSNFLDHGFYISIMITGKQMMIQKECSFEAKTSLSTCLPFSFAWPLIINRNSFLLYQLCLFQYWIKLYLYPLLHQ